MTVAEAAPAATTGADAGVRPGVDLGGDAAPATGLAGLLGTVDHVGVGRLWVVASLLFLLVAGAAGAIIGAERLDTSEINFLDDALSELYSLHGTSAIFLFLVPAFLGVATAIVPLQVGAATVAFPRAAAAAFWGWFLSSGVVLASYAVDGGPGGSDIDGRLLWAVGLGGVVVSLCLAALCVVTTVWTLRTEGMSLDRVPAFSWSMLVAGTIWLLTLPVLFAGIVLFYLESQYDVALSAGSFLRWVFGPPQVFAFALPALGVLADVVPVAAGVRQRNHGVVLGAIGAGGILSFGAYAVGSAGDAGVTQDALYVGAAFAIALPLLALAGGAADTLRRGRLNLTSPLLFGVVALVCLLLGAVAGAVRVIDNLDLVGTTADPAVAHLALAGGAVALVGALHHWAPKLFGAVLSEGIGRGAAVLLLVGVVVLAVPDLVSGLLEEGDTGQLAGIAEIAPVADGVEALNAVSLAGGALLVLAVLLVLVNLVGAAARRPDEDAPDDPWDGQTLEWATSPPPAPVTSAAPLLDLKEAQA